MAVVPFPRKRGEGAPLPEHARLGGQHSGLHVKLELKRTQKDPLRMELRVYVDGQLVSYVTEISLITHKSGRGTVWS